MLDEPLPGRRGSMSVVFALARLKAGVAPAQAEAEGTAAARTMVAAADSARHTRPTEFADARD